MKKLHQLTTLATRVYCTRICSRAKSLLLLYLYTGQNDSEEENCRTNSDDTSDKVHQRSHDHVRESHFHFKKSPTTLDQEILAAEEFERTSYCHLDFDPEIEWF